MTKNIKILHKNKTFKIKILTYKMNNYKFKFVSNKIKIFLMMKMKLFIEFIKLKTNNKMISIILINQIKKMIIKNKVIKIIKLILKILMKIKKQISYKIEMKLIIKMILIYKVQV